MSKFILLHDAENEASPIIINSDNILFVKESDILTGVSYIELNDVDKDASESSFLVTETREQIFEMLK